MIQPKHFDWRTEGRVGVITLNRPERKNPLTFESYAELRDLFSSLKKNAEVKAVVITGAGGNFCSASDVVKAMRHCPQPVIAAVEGVCAGAGAILAMACDLRYGAPGAKVAFLFVRVGLAGCDMGACAMLPRIIGQGRAAELLYTGRSMSAEEGLAWGFFNAVGPASLDKAIEVARELAAGPTAAHAMTKRMLHQEWNAGVDEAIEMEAQAQAILMQNRDFRRAYEAFAAKQKPVFQGD
jgi:enoyl-CoA hydratase/carnithine racemase